MFYARSSYYEFMGITRNHEESQGVPRNSEESQGITRHYQEVLGIHRTSLLHGAAQRALAVLEVQLATFWSRTSAGARALLRGPRGDASGDAKPSAGRDEVVGLRLRGGTAARGRGAAVIPRNSYNPGSLRGKS